jgi:hemerythrin superfamily protein
MFARRRRGNPGRDAGLKASSFQGGCTMATRERTRSSNGNPGGSKGAFGFGGQGGVLAAAAVAGAAVGLAANFGRKAFVQGMSAAAGDWAEALAAEHKAVLAHFDALEATADNQSWKRAHCLTRIKNALGKHALEEENVVYPALREKGEIPAADTLNSEHGYVKTYLYELENMPKEGPAFLAKVREFRAMLEAHMSEEEDEVFPALKARLSEEENGKLGRAMRREGMKLA